MSENILENNRCDCGKLLFKSSDLCGKIEIKCKRCGRIKTIERGFDDFLLKDAGKFAYGSESALESNNVSELE